MRDEPMTERRPEDIEAYPYSEIDMDMHIEAVTKELKDALRWIADQRWNEDADLDDICTRAEQALTTRLGEVK
jgi:hypothetical protein